MKFFRHTLFIYSLLGIVIVIAAFLRFNALGSVPVSLYWDEAADAYNAYSLLLTGKDEHGYTYPLLIRSFDDYKMPGMVYLMSVGIGMFGLNEFGIRFFNAVFGVLMVLTTFFFVKELLRHENIEKLFKTQHKETVISILALLTAFLLAISPWHIQFTRTGYEASMATTVFLIGVVFFLKSLHNDKMLFLSAFFFALSLYFYRSMFLFLGLFLIAIGLIFGKEILTKMNRKMVIASALLFIVVALPITYKVFTPPGNSRGNEVSIFNNVDEKVSQYQLWAIQTGNGHLGNIIFNKRTVYLTEILNNYFSHFTVQFLFLFGDANERHAPRNMGMMYLWELPFLLLGIYALLIYAANKVKLTVFAWLLIAPVPAAISIFAPHALRTFNMLPIPQLIVAIGIMFGWYHFRKLFRPFYGGLIVLSVSFFLFSYLFNYYYHSVRLSAQAWGDGYKQANLYVAKHEKEYDIVLISGHYWQPYVYTLLYTKYDPYKYQEAGDRYRFGKYRFGGTSWEDYGPKEYGDVDLFEIAGNKKALVVLSPAEYEKQKQNLRELTRIMGYDQSTRFIIGELVKPQDETEAQ